MRLWPFSGGETEKREASTYSDALIALLTSRASGASTAPRNVGPVEVVAGMFERSFASATVTPDSVTTRALTPQVLAMIGRGLALNGEIVFEIEVDENGVRLVPITSYKASGSVRDIMYRIEQQGPTMTTTKTVPAESVVHVKYGVTSAKSWEGNSPLSGGAGVTVALMGHLEEALRDETSGPRGSLIPTAPFEEGDGFTALQADINALKGETSLVESVRASQMMPVDQAPKDDYMPRRIGANPPQSLVMLREQTERSVLASAGVPVSIMSLSDGTQSREQYRQYLHSTLKPLGRIVTTELADKLAQPDLTLSFEDLAASDITNRGRALKQFVDAGVSLTDALLLAGLVVNDAD